MKKNILILGVSGNVSQGIVMALRNNKICINIVGACVFQDSIGKYLVDKFFVSPYADAPDFIPWLIRICNEEKIDFIFSGVEENIKVISEYSDYIKRSTPAKFVVASPEQLRIGNDKYLTAQWLKAQGLNYPRYAMLDNSNELEKLMSDVAFPVIGKPTGGKGSHGVQMLESMEDLELLRKKCTGVPYVIQELLGDECDEYTVATYRTQYNVFAGMIVMQRQLKNGTTVLASTVHNEIIFAECRRISDAFNAVGPLNIQLRMHKGVPTCFELTVRFSGTVPMRDLLGFKDAFACLREYCFEDGKVEKYLEPRDGKVIRYESVMLVSS